MSNFIYGYIKTNETEHFITDLQTVFKEEIIGFQFIQKNELYGFPDSLIPPDDIIGIYYVNISDSKLSKEAEYLIDFEDYCSNVNIGLPNSGAERVEILISVIEKIFTISGVYEVIIALTDCCEIEGKQKVSLSDIRDIFLSDLTEYAPSNKIYCIKK